MKQIIFTLLISFVAQLGFAQVQDGTLTINGTVDFSQLSATMEAGLNDVESFDSSTVPELSFILNPTTNPVTGGTTSSEQNCETVYLYKVFINTVNAPAGAIVKAKTFDNSGKRYPLVSNYDQLLPALQYFGERNLTAETNGADADGFITIPNSDSAIKVFEFKGCREEIPIEFRVSPDVFTPSGISNFDVVYTITAEPFN